MEAERVKLDVQPREQTGSRESRRLRREGLIPGVLYERGRAVTSDQSSIVYPSGSATYA